MPADPIPHSRPSVGREEADEAHRVILSGNLAEGPEVAAFEGELASWLKAERAAAVAHGTGGLHLSLLGLGAQPGTSVVLPSYCCVSVLNPVLYTGATPILVDCLPDAPEMDLEQARSKIREDTVAVIVPHLFGRTVPLAPFPVPVLEDATQSLGAPGIGKVGVATVYSFYATKMIGAGEGGAVVSRLVALDRLIRERRSYDGRIKWVQRYNYKMTDVAAAMLRVQLRKLSGFLQRRAELAGFYRERLKNLDFPLPVEQPGQVFYRFVLEVENLQSVQNALEEMGISAKRPVFRPIHFYLKLPRSDYPHSEQRWRTSLSLPLYPSLSWEQAERVVKCVQAACQRVR